MPLIILGFIVILAISAYWFVTKNSADSGNVSGKSRDSRSAAFEEKARDLAREIGSDVRRSIRRRAGIFDADYDIEDDGYGEEAPASEYREPGSNTIRFPSDVEGAKRKRDIH